MKLFNFFFFLLFYISNLHSTEQPNKFNITISENPKFVWFRVAKTGTNSISKVFLDNNIDLTVNGFKISFFPNQYRDYFKFTFVRNPWERVVSCYFNKVLTKVHPYYKKCFDKDFNFFIDFINQQDLDHADCHIRLQTQLIPIDQIDFIGHFETFSEDLQYIASNLGIILKEIPHQNQTHHSHYTQYYSEETKRIIDRKYKKDIEAFGYQFEYEVLESNN